MLHRENQIKAPSTTSAADLLRETMEYYEITLVDFAKQIGISPKELSELFNHRRYMSSTIALRIEKVTGISSKLLLNIDKDFNLSKNCDKESKDAMIRELGNLKRLTS